MQTIYCTTANITSRPSKVVDLEDYRARLAVQGSLAPRLGEEEWDGVIPGPWAPPPRRRSPLREEEAAPRTRSAPPRRAALAAGLEVWASLGVILMTLAFTLRILLV